MHRKKQNLTANGCAFEKNIQMPVPIHPKAALASCLAMISSADNGTPAQPQRNVMGAARRDPRRGADPCAAPAAVQPLPWLREEASNRSKHQNFKSRGGSAFCRAAPWLKENVMNPNFDFLGICQLLKALRTVGFSETEIKKIARRIAIELGANFTLYA